MQGRDESLGTFSLWPDSPAVVTLYAAERDELLKNLRSLTPRRNLRQLYLDPVTGKPFLVIPSLSAKPWRHVLPPGVVLSVPGRAAS